MRRRGRMVPTTRRGQRGLALAEVLVAFFLLFVITLAVLEMLSMAFMVNQAAGMRMEPPPSVPLPAWQESPPVHRAGMSGRSKSYRS